MTSCLAWTGCAGHGLVPELELHLLAAYASARRTQNPQFDAATFARLYAVMGAQRATKILGIFARLDKRDGKPPISGICRASKTICAAISRIRTLRNWRAVSEPSAGALGRISLTCSILSMTLRQGHISPYGRSDN